MIDQDLDQDPRYLADMDSLLDRIVKRTRSARLHLDKKTPWLAMLAAHLRALDTTPEPEPAPAPAPDVEPELVIHPNARRYKPVEEGPIVDLDLVAQLRAEGKTWRDIRSQVGINIHRMMADVRMWRPDLLGGDPHSKTNIHRKAIDLDRVEVLVTEGYKWSSIAQKIGVCHKRLLRIVETERPHLVKHDEGA